MCKTKQYSCQIHHLINDYLLEIIYLNNDNHAGTICPLTAVSINNRLLPVFHDQCSSREEEKREEGG